MSRDELRLFARLLAVARGRRMESGHRAMVVMREPGGHCRYTNADPVQTGTRVEHRTRVYHCGEKCLELQAVIRDAEALLATSETPEVRQVPMLLERVS